MIKKFALVAVAASLCMSASPAAFAQSSGRKAQEKGTAEIPQCSRKLGTIALVEPENRWWTSYGLSNPEAILRVFIQKSGCFTLVNRGRSMQSRNMERALADSGELQRGSNLGKGQVRAADYFLQPDLVTSNNDSGGNRIGGALGGLVGGAFGAIAGGINMKKKEANVTLSIVNARTTEEEALVEGYARKRDLGFSGGGLGVFGAVAGVAGSGYENTDIGQVIVLAYLDAYTKLVGEMGGLPENAAAAAPQAQ